MAQAWRTIRFTSRWRPTPFLGYLKRRRDHLPSGNSRRRTAWISALLTSPNRATADPSKFNQRAELPYELRLADFELAMQDVYDLLFDVNTALLSRGLMRLEETVRPAIFSGILSDAASASVARHSRVLTENRFHNGHPDLIPHGRYVNDAVKAGEDGVEIKATKGGGAVDTHGARDAWLCVFRYHVDTTTEPIV